MDFIYQLGGVAKLDSDLEVEFHNPGGSVVFTPPALRDRRSPCALEHTIFGDDFAFLRDAVTTAVPKLTIPSPSMVHYRGGRSADRRDGLPRPGRVLGRPHGGLPRGGQPARRARLHATCSSTTRASPTSTTRRSASTSREIGGDPEHQHEVYIRHLNEAIASRPDGHAHHDAHVPRQLPLVVVRLGRLRVRRRGAAQRARRSTASSWSTTTSARAASSRCASCRPASSSCSASSRPRAASSSARTSSSAGSRRPRSSPTSTSSASRRSAASRRRSTATT